MGGDAGGGGDAPGPSGPEGARTVDPGHGSFHESAIFVLSGALRMEFGPGGADSFDAGPGDFVYVPRGVINRESDPSDQPADIVVVRAGTGESVVNVDGPEPGLTLPLRETAGWVKKEARWRT